jgi:hypothetical protein
MKFIAGWFTKSCQIAGASPRAQAQQCRITCEMTGAMALGKSKLSSRHSELKTKMGRFSNSLDGPPAPFPQSFDLDVLRRRIKEVRRDHIRASGRLFDMCYSIQKTGELPDPEELSYALADFFEARAMAEFLDEMNINVQVMQAAPSRNP